MDRADRGVAGAVVPSGRSLDRARTSLDYTPAKFAFERRWRKDVIQTDTSKVAELTV